MGDNMLILLPLFKQTTRHKVVTRLGGICKEENRRYEGTAPQHSQHAGPIGLGLLSLTHYTIPYTSLLLRFSVFYNGYSAGLLSYQAGQGP